LQRLEQLEHRISFISATSISRNNNNQDAAAQQSHGAVDVAVEAVLHLLDRLLITLQCWAADAGTISNAATASRVEVLVQYVMHGFEMAVSKASRADKQGNGSGQTSSWQQEVNVMTHLGVLRNAVSSRAHQRLQDLERQVPAMQLQLADSMARIQAAESARARCERELQLKSQAVESIQQQLALSQFQLAQLHKMLASGDWQLQQLQQDLMGAKLQLGQAEAAALAQSSELQAVHGRARNAEVILEQQQTMVAEAAAANSGLLEQLQKAVEASRQGILDQRAAASAAATAQQKCQHLQTELAAANARISEVQNAVQESRQRADICTQSAREAQYKAVQTQTLLADARRELDFTQHCLAQLRQDVGGAKPDQQQQQMSQTLQ
jgi:chromosome segregation ATPase